MFLGFVSDKTLLLLFLVFYLNLNNPNKDIHTCIYFYIFFKRFESYLNISPLI